MLHVSLYILILGQARPLGRDDLDPHADAADAAPDLFFNYVSLRERQRKNGAVSAWLNRYRDIITNEGQT